MGPTAVESGEVQRRGTSAGVAICWGSLGSILGFLGLDLFLPVFQVGLDGIVNGFLQVQARIM